MGDGSGNTLRRASAPSVVGSTGQGRRRGDREAVQHWQAVLGKNREIQPAGAL